MKKQDEQFDQWVEYAKARYEVRLMNGEDAILQAVRQNAMSVKILYRGRFVNCWVDDIALLRAPKHMRRRDPELTWFRLLPWQAPVLEQSPGTSIRSLNAPRSKHWLTVTPAPERLHPSFFPINPVTPRV